MRFHWLIVPLGICVFSCASVVVRADSWQDLYVPAVFKNAAGQTMPYRLLKPEKIEPGQAYPLMLFLHGVGERGTDNRKQLANGANELAKQEIRRKHPCFIVAPQCPGNARWADFDWTLTTHKMPEKPYAPLVMAMELTDSLANELPVDKRRVYITGLSMGGFGVWDAIQRWPDRFAAAIPVCGGGDVTQAPRLKNLPIWAFHGNLDVIVPASRTLSMIDAIKAAGGSPKVTTYPLAGHVCWVWAYSDSSVADWLFSQQKQ